MSRQYVVASPYWTVAEPRSPYVSSNETTPLSRHADDLYKLLLRRLTAIEAVSELTMDELSSLRAIFEEYLIVLRMSRIE